MNEVQSLTRRRLISGLGIAIAAALIAVPEESEAISRREIRAEIRDLEDDLERAREIKNRRRRRRRIKRIKRKLRMYRQLLRDFDD